MWVSRVFRAPWQVVFEDWNFATNSVPEPDSWSKSLSGDGGSYQQCPGNHLVAFPSRKLEAIAVSEGRKTVPAAAGQKELFDDSLAV